jgi:hypothetical protein
MCWAQTRTPLSTDRKKRYFEILTLSLFAPELFWNNEPHTKVIRREMSKKWGNRSRNPNIDQIRNFLVAPSVPTLAVTSGWFIPIFGIIFIMYTGPPSLKIVGYLYCIRPPARSEWTIPSVAWLRKIRLLCELPVQSVDVEPLELFPDTGGIRMRCGLLISVVRAVVSVFPCQWKVPTFRRASTASAKSETLGV